MKKSLVILLGLVAASLAGRFSEQLLTADKNLETVQRIWRCIKDASTALFTPSNDVSIIVPNRTHHPDLVQEMSFRISTYADRVVKIFTKFPDESNSNFHPLARESSFVLIDNDVNLRQRMEHSFVSRWAEYILITEATTQWLSKLADHLWNLGFVKVAFIRVTSNGSTTVLRPIQSPFLRGSAPSLKAFDLCDENTTSTVSLPGKIRQVTTGHPFSSMLHTPTNGTLTFARVLEGTQSENDFSSIDANGNRTNFGGTVIQMFATKFNMELVKHKWKNQDTSTWTDARDRCVAGEFDIFYARELAPGWNCCREIKPIAWYTFETLVFVDSLKSSLHPLRGLLLPYGGIVWLCTVTLFGVFALFAFAIEILWRQNLVRERITVLGIWSIFVGQSLPVHPAKFSLRFVLGMWMLYTLNNNLLYTGMFSSTLTAIDNNNILHNFQDLLDSGRPICGNKKTEFLLNDAKDPIVHSIHDRLELTASTDVISKILNDNYICSRHSRYVIAHNWANRANDSLRLYIPSEAVIVNYPSFYFAKKRHPYSKDFSTLVSNIRDSGVLAYVAQQNRLKLGKTKAEYTLATDQQLLTLKHLQVIFIILFIGHFISSLVFLVELYMPIKPVNRRGPRK